MASRPWTTGEQAKLREMCGRVGSRFIAATLGRSVGAVTQRAKRLGLSVHTPQLPADFRERLRELHRKGYSDPDVAKMLGVNIGTVCKHRNTMGLAANRFGRRHREKLARNWMAQRREAGVKSLAELRDASRSLRIFNAGWPAGLKLVHARVLDVLESGPKTKRELCKALGYTSPVMYCLRHDDRNVLWEMIRMGLVRVLGTRRVPGQVRAWHRVYGLAIARRHSSERGAA
jgi:hypothetical protein